MKYDPIPATPEVIRWARTRAGFALEELITAFRNIEAWEAGDASPSYPQLESMANKFKVPVAVFFFPEPPDLPLISESFRTLPEQEYEKIPPQIQFMLRKAKAYQLSHLNRMGNSGP